MNKSRVRSVLIFISRSPTSAGDGGDRLAGVIEGTTMCGRRCGDCVVTLVAADPADRRESPIRLLKGEFLRYQSPLEENEGAAYVSLSCELFIPELVRLCLSFSYDDCSCVCALYSPLGLSCSSSATSISSLDSVCVTSPSSR